jgi:hypothetical protein
VLPEDRVFAATSMDLIIAEAATQAVIAFAVE